MEGEEPSSSEESLDGLDQIAEMLTEDGDVEVDIEDKTEDEVTDDDEDEEAQAEESSKEVDESDKDDDSWESALGVDEGQIAYTEDGDIAGVNVKVSGESSTVGVQDLIAGYQNNKAFTQKSQALAEDRKDFDARLEQVAQVYKEKIDKADNLAAFLEKKIIQEFDSINWEQLRVENPAEYAAARSDFSSRASELQQYQEGIKAELGQQDQQAQEQQSQHHKQNLSEQFDKMITNNPTWNNKETLKSDMAGLRSFMDSQYGFNESDFDNVTDARVIELIKDAKAFREGQKIAKTNRKKPVPKYQKSSGRPAKKGLSKLDKLTKVARTARGDNKRIAQRDAIAELLGE